jgi:NADH dehydrogenase
MKVLVTGGTGFVGRNLCAELHERGHDVTAMNRTPDADVVPDGVDTVVGDVTAYDSIESAFEGQDAVVNLVALSPLYKPKGGYGRHFDVHLGGTENCVRAAEEHGVDRYVQQSALDADPNADTAYIQAKGEADEVVRSSSLDWTIFQPSVIFGDDAEFLSFTKKLTPPLVAGLPGGGKSRFQPIWIQDFVSIVADSLEDDAHVGQTYEIGGPEVLTLKQVAKRLRSNVLILPIPMPLAGLGLKTLGMFPGAPMGGDQYRSLKIDNTVEHNDVEAFGRSEADLLTLDEYLEGRQ